jgi:polar amino acid transport system permease protein
VRDWYGILSFLVVVGLPATLLLTAIGFLMGFIIGLSLALVRTYASEEIQWLAIAYEKVFRGIPVLVLMFIMAVGTSVGAILAGGLALGLRGGAYQSQIIRGAILSVDANQAVAASAIGMNRMQTARHIVLPQAFRLAIPAWSNEYAVVLKDTAWAGQIGVLDMLQGVDYITAEVPVLFFTATIVVTVIYFLLTYPVTRIAAERMSKRLKELGLGGR